MIQTIFQMYLDEKGPTAIADTLSKLGFTGRNGKPLTANGILYILSNESYVDDKHLQKRAPKNFLTKQPEKNVQYEDRYLIDDHEGIVSRESWDAVQERLNARREDLRHGVIKYHGGRTHFLFGKVFCEECGSPMTRRTLFG